MWSIAIDPKHSIIKELHCILTNFKALLKKVTTRNGCSSLIVLKEILFKRKLPLRKEENIKIAELLPSVCAHPPETILARAILILEYADIIGLFEQQRLDQPVQTCRLVSVYLYIQYASFAMSF